MKKQLWILSLAVATAGIAHADYNPVVLTSGSFNADVIVEKTAARSINDYTTATVDAGTNNSGSTFYEQGYNPTQPWTGLPVHGTTFVALSNANHTFKMAADYTLNNTVMVGNYAGFTSGSLTLAPTAVSTLSILATAGNGPANLNYTIHHSGGGTETGTLGVDDWTGGTNIAWPANGRVVLDNGNLASQAYTNGTNRRLLFYDIPLIDTVNPVTSVDFSYVSGGRALIYGASGSSGGDYNPITAGGFNADTIVELGAPIAGFSPGATVTMDGGKAGTGNTWYEQGYRRDAPTTGIPHPGTTVTVGNHSFTMAPSYTANDVFFLSADSGYTNVTVTLSTPTAYSSLSFLGSSGNGGQNINVVVHHSSDPDELLSFNAGDWFNGASPIITAAGREVPNNFGSDNVGGTNPRLYAFDLGLGGSSPVTSIDLSYPNGPGGNTMIFAVSGSTGGNFNPIAVSGYNGDGVLEATLPNPARPNPLLGATIVSMDGGTNNTGNTWYEQGYYRDMPASGLPAAGSTLTSAALPDHHYQMPASYTANNAVYVDSTHTNADLQIASPATYSALSFLSSAANGVVTNAVLLYYADHSVESNYFISQDWFNNTPFAFSPKGRMSLDNGTINNDPGRTATVNPRLYEAQFALGNVGSPVTNIHLQFLGAANPTAGRVVIFAVSGTAGAIAPIISSITPAAVTKIEGTSQTIAINVTGGTTPISYQWQAGAIGSGVWTNLSNGGTFSGVTTITLNINNINYFTNNADYRCLASNVAGTSVSGVCTMTVLSGLADIPQPGDPIVAIGGSSSPGTEGVEHAIDDFGQKYLRFSSFPGPVGFIVTPSIGSTILSVMRLYTANDAPERDPMDYILEGSNDGGTTWAPISSGALTLALGRNSGGNVPLDPLTQTIQEVRFSNSASYTSYRWTVNNVRDNTSGIMQIGEVELLGVQTPTPPVITLQPVSTVTNFVGGHPTFTVAAHGFPTNLLYQWRQNGTDIAGATSSSYTKLNVQLSDSGKVFDCRISNLNGTVFSTSSILYVIAVPTSPLSGSIIADNPIAWFRLDEGDDGSGNNGRVANDYWGGHAGIYTNVVLNQPGYAPAVDSDKAAQFGIFNPSDSVVRDINGIDFSAPSGPANFSVEAWANGGGQLNGAGIVAKGTGGGGEQFNLDVNAGFFRFFIRDSAGNVAGPVQSTVLATDNVWHHVVGVADGVNNKLTLYVDGVPSASTFLPANGVKSSTSPITIGGRSSAVGTGNDLQFVGVIDEVAIYNHALTADQVANHYYGAQFGPAFVYGPTNTTANENGPVTFYSSAYGAGGVTYQWYNVTAGDPGTAISGATSSNLVIAVATAAMNGNMYRVVATSPFGSVTNPSVLIGPGATLGIIGGAPSFATDIPASLLVYAGGTVVYAPVVTGTEPITYQWKKNGVNLINGGRISGATSRVLNIASSRGSDGGQYQLFASNAQGGPVPSTLSTLTVESRPDFNVNGLGWTVQHTAPGGADPTVGTIHNDMLTLTVNAGSTASSAWYNYPVYIGQFRVSFTYTNDQGADGMVFGFQNDSRGPTALGGAGGAMGFSGIAPSAGLDFNIYGPNVVGMGFNINGNVGPFSGTGPVAIDALHPNNVTLNYDGSVLHVTLTDPITSATYNRDIPANLPGILGGTTAFMGFTGGDGGATSQQDVYNFVYIPVVSLTAQPAGANTLKISWPAAGGYILQSATNVTGPFTDDPATITPVGGNNQITISTTGSAKFYRLSLDTSEP
jgi:hypothetical protein